MRCALHKVVLAAGLAMTLASAAPPGAAREPVTVERDGQSVVLHWQAGPRQATARISPEPGGTVGSTAWCFAGPSNVVAAWEGCASNRLDLDVFVQQFTGDGTPLFGPEGIAVNQFRDNQRRPAVAVTATGDMFVVWQSDSAGQSNNNIWCQRILVDGRLAWAKPAAVCTAPGDQTCPAIAEEPDGQVIIAWEDRRNGTADIYGQRIAPDGAPTGPEDGWAIESAPGDQNNVRFLRDRMGRPAFIAWTDYRPGSATPVEVQTDLAQLPVPEPVCAPLCVVAVVFLFNRLRNPV